VQLQVNGGARLQGSHFKEGLANFTTVAGQPQEKEFFVTVDQAKYSDDGDVNIEVAGVSSTLGDGFSPRTVLTLFGTV